MRPLREVALRVPRGVMRVRRLVSEPFSVNVWVVVDGDEALVVDAGMGADAPALARRIREAAGAARVVGLYCTHPHCDHVGGCRILHDDLACEVRIAQADVKILESGDNVATLGAILGAKQSPCPARGLSEGDVVRVGETHFEVLRTPGHTPEHTALFDRGTGTLFSGDVVFAHGSFGRVDFPGGDADALVASLRRLASLPVERVFPGHMEPIETRAREAIEESLANADAML